MGSSNSSTPDCVCKPLNDVHEAIDNQRIGNINKEAAHQRDNDESLMRRTILLGYCGHIHYRRGR